MGVRSWEYHVSGCRWPAGYHDVFPGHLATGRVFTSLAVLPVLFVLCCTFRRLAREFAVQRIPSSMRSRTVTAYSTYWHGLGLAHRALGTSSPEIMLSLVEALLTLGKPAGELGPSCIAGSAAYNFLMVSGSAVLCGGGVVLTIPDREWAGGVNGVCVGQGGEGVAGAVQGCYSFLIADCVAGSERRCMMGLIRSR